MPWDTYQGINSHKTKWRCSYMISHQCEKVWDIHTHEMLSKGTRPSSLSTSRSLLTSASFSLTHACQLFAQSGCLSIGHSVVASHSIFLFFSFILRQAFALEGRLASSSNIPFKLPLMGLHWNENFQRAGRQQLALRLRLQSLLGWCRLNSAQTSGTCCSGCLSYSSVSFCYRQ